MNSSKTAHILRNRIGRFSGNVSEGLCLSAQRFVGEVIYGMQVGHFDGLITLLEQRNGTGSSRLQFLGTSTGSHSLSPPDKMIGHLLYRSQ